MDELAEGGTSESQPADEESPVGLFGLAVFLTALFAGGYFFHGREFANSDARWGLVQAIVVDQSLEIDRYLDQTSIDRAVVNGRVYSDKAPGSSLWGVPAYWLARHLSGLLGHELNEPDGRYFTRIWVSTVPTAVAAWLLFRILAGQGVPAGGAAAIAALSVLGTCAWAYATLIYGHQLAAMFVVAALALLVDEGRDAGRGPAWWRVALAGLCIGYGVLTEYPVILAGAILGIYALWRCRPWWKAGWFIAGGMPAAVALATYNHAVFGSILASGYDFEELQRFSTGMSAGVGGVTYPRLDALWLLTGSLSRGLFVGSPFLLLAAPGFAIAMRRAPRRNPWIVAAAIGVVFLLFNASYYMPGGGTACGPRHLLPAMPCYAMLCGGVLLAGASAWWQVALVGLAIPAIVRQAVATAIEPHVDDRALNPWRDFWQPLAEAGFQSISPVGRMGMPVWVSLGALAVAFAIIWLPLVPAGKEGRPLMGHASPWRRWWAYVGVVGLTVACLAPNLSAKTPGPAHPLVAGTLLYNNGYSEEAMKMFEVAIRTAPASDGDRQFIVLAWENLGRIAAQKQEDEAAAQCFQEAVKLAPRNKHLRHLLAVALSRIGRNDAARRELRAALEIDPEFKDAQRSLRVLEESDKP